MAHPSSTNPAESPRFQTPHSAVDSGDSILAGSNRPASTDYPSQGPRLVPEQRPQGQAGEYDEKHLPRYDTTEKLKGDNATIVSVSSEEEEQVLGSTELFDKDGNIRLVPVGDLANHLESFSLIPRADSVTQP